MCAESSVHALLDFSTSPLHNGFKKRENESRIEKEVNGNRLFGETR